MAYTRREFPRDKRHVLGARLRRLRAAKSLTLKDVAAHLGLKAPSQVSGWETGDRTPELPSLLRLASLYERPIDQLLIGVDVEYDKLIARRVPIDVREFAQAQADAAHYRALELVQAAFPLGTAPTPQTTAGAQDSSERDTATRTARVATKAKKTRPKKTDRR